MLHPWAASPEHLFTKNPSTIRWLEHCRDELGCVVSAQILLRQTGASDFVKTRGRGQVNIRWRGVPTQPGIVPQRHTSDFVCQPGTKWEMLRSCLLNEIGSMQMQERVFLRFAHSGALGAQDRLAWLDAKVVRQLLLIQSQRLQQ